MVSSSSRGPEFPPLLGTAISVLFGLLTLQLILLGARPIGLFLLYVISFSWLPWVLTTYSKHFPVAGRISEDALVKKVKGISIGIAISVLASLSLVLETVFVSPNIPRIRALLGLASVWLGSILLPFLSVGPAYTVLLERNTSKQSLLPTRMGFSGEAQAMFSVSVIMPELRRYALKFIAACWVSTLLVTFGWIVIFGDATGLIGLIVVPIMLLTAKYLNLPSVQASDLIKIRVFVDSVGRTLPYRGRSIVAVLIILSALMLANAPLFLR